MALVLNDRVKETSTTTGQGTLSLAGAATGFETFVAGVGDGNTTYYLAAHESDGTWELGIGTITDASPDTLARTTVIDTSAGNTTKIDFASGSKTIFCTLPASKAVFLDADGDVTLGANLDVGGNLTVTGTTTFNGGTLTLGDANTDNIVFGGEVDSNIIPDDDNTHDLGSSSKEWKDIYIDGVAYLDAINFDGTAISATAAELNIMDGVTSTTAELNILDGVTSTTAELNILDGVTATTAELNYSDTGASVGTVVASKVVTADANKDVASFRNVTLTGELDAATLDISGNADIDGTTNLDAVDIDGAVQIDAAVTVGVDDTGYDFKLFGATSGSFLLWDESDDALELTDSSPIKIGDGGDMTIYHDGSHSYVTNATGTLKLATETSGIAVTIGHTTSEVTVGDNLTVTGDLTVSGTTTTVNSTTVNLNDHNIVLDTGNSTSAVVNGAGITIEGGSGDDATFTYSTTGPKFELKLGSSYEDLQVDQLIAASLDISGDVDVDGTLEADAITVNGTTLAEFISDTAGAMVSSNTETGITVTYQDADNTIDFELAAAQTTISSLTNTSLVIGRDADNDIDFATDNNIIFRAAGADQIVLKDGVLEPVTDGDISLGSTGSKRFHNLFLTGVVTTSSNINAGGNLNLNGIFEIDVASGDPTIIFDTQGADKFHIAVDDSDSDNLVIKSGGTVGSGNGLKLDSSGNLTVTAELDAATLDISGDADIDGTLETDALSINGTSVTSTAAELNILDGVTATATELNLLDGGTSVGSSITLANGDGIVTNDGGTMKTIPASDIKTYVGAAAGAFSIANLDIDGGTDIGADLVGDDLIIVDDGAGGTNRKATLTRLMTFVNANVSGGGGSSAADDLTAGDAAVNLTTTSGNITIDAQANDSDIIFKGTDGGADTTFLTIDGSDAGKALFNAGATFSSNVSISTADNTDTLTLISTDADASGGPVLDFYRNSSSPADNDTIGKISFRGRNDNSEDVDYGIIDLNIVDASDGTEDGSIFVRAMRAGTLTEFMRFDPGSDGIVVNDSGADIDFRVESSGDANCFVVNAGDDKVGIGTNAPDQLLHVNKDQNTDTAIRVKNNTAGTAARASIFLDANAGGGQILALSGSFTTSGNYVQDSLAVFADTSMSNGMYIGARASSSSLKLIAADAIQASVTGDGIKFADNKKTLFGDGNDLQIYHSGSSSYITNATGDLTLDLAADLVIDADGGDVIFQDGGTLIGTIDMANSDFKIQSNVSDKDILISGNDGGTTQTVAQFDMSDNGALICKNNVTAFGSPSDIRLKENIEVIPNALDKVSQLQGITFNYKKDGRRSTGLIAQELEKVLPEVVYDTHEVGNDDEEFKAVRYGNTVGLLVEAIKELKTEVEELKNKIC